MEEKLKKEIKEIETKIDNFNMIAIEAHVEVIELKKQLNNRKQLLKNADAEITLSDHALMRYIERVYKFDLEVVKKEILETEGLKAAAKFGANRFSKNGKSFVIKDNKIITVY